VALKLFTESLKSGWLMDQRDERCWLAIGDQPAGLKGTQIRRVASEVNARNVI
jgi:hypothetical protein